MATVDKEEDGEKKKGKAVGGDQDDEEDAAAQERPSGAALASERAKTAARTAYEAWQARNRLPDETDEDLLRPVPPPLVFEIDQPELLDEDQAEILAMSEVRPRILASKGRKSASNVSEIHSAMLHETRSGWTSRVRKEECGCCWTRGFGTLCRNLSFVCIVSGGQGSLSSLVE